MIRIALGSILILGILAAPLSRADAPIDEALLKKAEASVAAGATFLMGQQSELGSWSSTNFPSVTALAAWALMRSDLKTTETATQRALKFVNGCRRSGGLFSGSIYVPVRDRKGGGLINYNTAICMAVLHASGDPAYRKTVLDARAFLVRSQYVGDTVHNGGMGYDPPTGRPYTDLSNSYLAYEAMRMTQDAEDSRPGGERVELDWKAAVAYIERCHNDPRFNDQAWASDDKSERGGFAYRPDTFRQNSGSFEGEDGVVKFRTMPGMTYAGLLSYIHAGVTRDDPRVKATVQWIVENWQLERGNRNPEMRGRPEEKEGLFYMYNVLSKGLSAFGQNTLTLSDGSELNWREALIEKLIALQGEDGSWINENGRYWENDKALVTAYTLLALNSALGR